MSGSGEERDGEGPEGPGFVVIDKRGREQAGDDAGSPSEPRPDAEAPAGAPEPGAGGAAGSSAGPLPEVDFSALAISLGTSAMMHLGIVADPVTGQTVEKNLPLAHQTIDTLAMLQEKTRGNLTAEEERLLQNLLTELRMRYVEAGR